MTSHVLAVQGAIKGALEAHTALGATVYDDVPQNAAFPYVSIGDDTAIPDDDKTKDGQEITCTIHTWSRYRGRKEVKEIMAEIRNVLHDGDLSISGGDIVLIRCEFETSFVDPDGETRHGVQRFRIMAHDS